MQDVFTKGMNRWFALKEFQVGVPTEGIDQRSSFEELQSRINKVGSLSTTVGRALNSLPHARRVGGGAAKTGKLGGVPGRVGKLGGAAGKIGKAGGVAGTVVLLSDFLIDTETSAADLYDALKPYISRADIIALKISNAKAWRAFREHPDNKTFWNTVLVPVIYADELTLHKRRGSQRRSERHAREVRAKARLWRRKRSVAGSRSPGHNSCADNEKA
jgi:hypothetical protein